MERILVIDDDRELCELITEYFAPEGLAVEAVHQGSAGVDRALSGEHDLAILDVMLPGVSGLDLLRQIRARSRLPVLMLTARGQDVDRIIGLELGADDYLPKPFHPRELVARIRAILRRSRPEPPRREKLCVGDVELDTGTRLVRCAGTSVDLTAVEFSLLEVLLRAAGRIVTREELVKAVLGREFMPYDRTIDMHVSKLRRKLGYRKGRGERIQTVRSAGYIYVQLEEPAGE